MFNTIHVYERVATIVLIGLAIAIAIPPMAAFAVDDVAYYRVHEFTGPEGTHPVATGATYEGAVFSMTTDGGWPE